jgi:hypothetical protein
MPEQPFIAVNSRESTNKIVHAISLLFSQLRASALRNLSGSAVMIDAGGRH